jgi:hypothetical protein
MRQPTKQELALENNQLRSDNFKLDEALAAVMAGKDVLIGQFTLDGQTVKARLIGADRAHGGLIMYTSQCGRGDRPQHRVHFLEEQESSLRHASSDYARELRNLVGRARVKVYQLTHTPEETIVDVAVREMMPAQDGQHLRDACKRVGIL